MVPQRSDDLYDPLFGRRNQVLEPQDFVSGGRTRLPADDVFKEGNAVIADQASWTRKLLAIPSCAIRAL